MWTKASKIAKSMPIYSNSHRKEAANEVGALGEVVAEVWFKIHGIPYCDERENTTHDYLINGKYTLDVKTKDRTVPPKRYYECSVPAYNHSHQRPDYYLFVSLRRDRNNPDRSIRRFTDAYIVGGIDLEKLEEIKRVWKTDEVDPDNGTQFWTACLNVKMSDLIPLGDLGKSLIS